jgi:hypothetical protein
MSSTISRSRPTRVRFVPAALVASSLALVVLAGCYETELELAPPESAKIDPRFVGDWDFADKASADVTRMVIRNFNGREYYVAWDEAKAEPNRAAAFVVEVAGAKFAHVRGLTTEGDVSGKHFLERIDLTPDGKLSIRHLKGEFFEGKEVKTSEQLRKLVEANVNNEAMYDAETFYGTRVRR